MTKPEIRRLMRQLKAELSDEQKESLSQEVFAKIENCEVFKNACNVMLYHSLPDELPTHKIVVKWSLNKNVYLPRCNGDELDVVKFQPQTMQTGSFNIIEPQGEPVDKTLMDLVIVPAVAFDGKGGRVGRGKGYYDRLLNGCNATKIVVGYPFQLIEEVPAEEHDIKMNYIVTPDKFIEIK